MSVWDIGGQSLGSQMLDKYFHGASVCSHATLKHHFQPNFSKEMIDYWPCFKQAVLFVYDITNGDSFENLQDWFRIVTKNFESKPKQPYSGLIGNKCMSPNHWSQYIAGLYYLCMYMCVLSVHVWWLHLIRRPCSHARHQSNNARGLCQEVQNGKVQAQCGWCCMSQNTQLLCHHFDHAFTPDLVCFDSHAKTCLVISTSDWCWFLSVCLYDWCMYVCCMCVWVYVCW